MHARLIAAASLAILASSCSSIYDTTDFLSSRTRAVAEKADVAAADAESPEDKDSGAASTAEAAETGAPETAAAAAAPDTADGSGPEGEQIAEAATASPVRSLLAMFRAAPAVSAPAAKAAEEAAGPGTPPGTTGETTVISQEEAVRTGVLVENPKGDEFSEADLAGEVEADPDEIAVPEQPWDDGLEHDFVNVYTSKPDAAEPTVPGLPGVTWEKDIVLVSRGPNGDPSDFFGGGSVHPFARTVPGIPQKVVQAANGLLLQHAAINVGCLKPDLLNLVRRAESHFGKKVVVTSGYRSPAHNRRVNGAKHSQHMYCNALDLFMPGVARDDLARFFYAQPDRGGIGLYCHMKSIHVDTGRRREWRWPCRGRG